MTNKLRRWPLHPLLAAVYPVLALLANNISQVKPAAALRPLVLVICFAVLLWGLVLWIVRDVKRSALLVSWWLVLFFTYGHLYNFLEGHTSLGRHRYLLPAWIALALLGTWLIIKRVKDLPYATLVLNAIGLVLMVFPLVQLGSYSLRSRSASSHQQPLPAEFTSLQLPQEQAIPDVYYIILDAYARNDTLKSDFSYDNSAFSDRLREMGFYLASCSQSNYAQTELSLASSLNISYLDDLLGELPASSQDRLPLRTLLHTDAVRRAFRQLGYKFVAFETGFLFSQFEDADVYLSSGPLGGMSGFEVLLVKTSGGLAWVDAESLLPHFFREGIQAPETARYQQVTYTLDQLAKIPKSIPGPKFVFAHIVAPHGPWVLGSDGKQVHYTEPVDDATYIQAYRDELTYLNQRMQDILQTILADSPVPPIIIVQADHGHDFASSKDRMAILNAYYLPGDGEKQLYSTISPVNSFRVILDRYFGGKFELLEDRSYFSKYQTPYDFTVIPNACK